MEYLVTAKEMKTYDQNTIKTFEIPAVVLMERAALATLQVMKKEIGELNNKSILIVCGTGNNGGDGMAIGRLLMEEHHNVTFLLAGELDKYSEEARSQRKILDAYGVKYLTKYPPAEYDIIVDALLGIGLSREVKAEYQQIIHQMNLTKGIIVAVDIPSGVNADDGQILGCAVNARITVTYGYRKRGHMIFPGRAYCGNVFCDRIGITEKSFLGQEPGAYTYCKPITELLPKRCSQGNKGNFGKLLIIGGQEEMSGSVQLCTMGAFGSGAGMIKVMTHEMNRIIIQSNIPEAMVVTWNQELPYEKLAQSLEWADGVVIGPGLGQSECAKELLKYVLTYCNGNLVIDADGLNLLSQDTKLQQLVIKQAAKLPKAPVILTPHQKELSRLTGKEPAELKYSSGAIAEQLAKDWGVIVISKDATSFVCEKGKTRYINTAGNSGMATAGSGDVLAGIVGALLVQGLGSSSADLGVYLHALAGDRAAEKKNQYSMTARDIIEALSEVLK